MININGISKAKVLQALFNASKQQGLGFIDILGAADMTLEQAEMDVEVCTSFDYLRGRVLKVDISGNEFDPYLFDRDVSQTRPCTTGSPGLNC